MNPVRAKMAASLETSEFTSVLDRLTGHTARRGLAALGELAEPTLEQREMLGLARQQATADAWLCPMGTEVGRHTVLDMSIDGYLALVDWTGRQLAEGKPGVLSGESQEHVVKLGLDTAAWVETVRGFGRMFYHVVGSRDKLREQARRRNLCRARGKPRRARCMPGRAGVLNTRRREDGATGLAGGRSVSGSGGKWEPHEDSLPILSRPWNQRPHHFGQKGNQLQL